MDVIGFLCVSLGSSTVKLHDSIGSTHACACSEAGFSSQNGDRAWGVYYRRAAFFCAFFVVRRTQCKGYSCFLFTVGSVYLIKRFTTGWWQTFRWWRRGWNGGVEVAKTTVERLLCCGFRRTGKAMGQVYECWWRICREINFFPGLNITCFTFMSIRDLFTDSPSYIYMCWMLGCCLILRPFIDVLSISMVVLEVLKARWMWTWKISGSFRFWSFSGQCRSISRGDCETSVKFYLKYLISGPALESAACHSAKLFENAVSDTSVVGLQIPPEDLIVPQSVK
jgi:hypothetical protein